MLLRNNSIFGIYSDDNPQTRSLLKQLDLIDNKPFVRVALVTVIGGVNVTPTPKPQRDLDNANTILPARVWGLGILRRQSNRRPWGADVSRSR